jgi:hypothetical protein
MNNSQSGDSGDAPGYEKALQKQADEALREIGERADKEREAAAKHADEAAQSVRQAIREQARRLSDEILSGSGAGDDDGDARPGTKEAKPGSKRKTSKKKKKKKKASKKRG